MHLFVNLDNYIKSQEKLVNLISMHFNLICCVTNAPKSTSVFVNGIVTLEGQQALLTEVCNPQAGDGRGH